MRHKIALIGASMCAGAIASTSMAHAQEAPYVEQTLGAPKEAFELKVGTGYTQGFGNIAPGTTVHDVAGPGIGVNVDADYRMDPHWSVGLQGEYQEFTNSDIDTSARGLAGNIGATYHAIPHMRGDPWFRLGTGYRLLWQVNPPAAPTTLMHGFELGKATIGYDLRVTPDVALAPLVGIDLNLFVWQNQNSVNTQLSTAQVGSFVFAGLQGRFDMGGRRTGAVVVASH
jgi:hypothetical protein